MVLQTYKFLFWQLFYMYYALTLHPKGTTLQRGLSTGLVFTASLHYLQYIYRKLETYITNKISFPMLDQVQQYVLA